jgi:hypothetical protein
MSRLQASLLGGLFIGILSALPIVGAANYCCCLWVIAGGVLTTYLRQQGRPVALEASEAAVSGLFAGLVGSVIYIAFSVLLLSVSGDMIESQIRTMAEQYPQMPPDVRDRLLAFSAGPNLVLLMAFVTIPMYAIFGMLGALLALLFFRKPTAPAAQA